MLADSDSKHAKANTGAGAASTLAIFGHTGAQVYVGQSKTGSIAVLDTDTLRFQDVVKVL